MTQKLTIRYRVPAGLIDYENNARTHPPEQVAQIAASIQQFGFNNPILLKDDSRTIGAGHGRKLGALLILSDPDRWGPLNTPDGKTVPTVTLKGLTEDEWKAYVIADNKIGLNAGWDMEILRAELRDIRDGGIDLELTGFGEVELQELKLDPDPVIPPTPPGQFPEYGEGIVTTYKCPSCGYAWSGKPHDAA